MANIKQVPIRLNLDDKEEAQAYEYIQNMDKTIYTSYTKVFTAAIINLFDDKSEPETTSKPAIPAVNSNTLSKEVNATDIAKTVMEEISNMLPELVASTLMRLIQMGGRTINNIETPSQKIFREEPVPQLSEEAWNFIDCING